MGQKVNPIEYRTGVIYGWKSKWYATKSDYSDLLVEDFQIRKYIKAKYKYAGIPTIEIERTRDEVKVVMHTARPGIVIGRKGSKIEELQDELQNLVGRRINIKIEEVNNPNVRAQLVAEDIAEQLARRASFRRTMKRSMEQTMESGAKGIKVQLSGRLGGAEMARREKQILGSMPLSTLRAKIDYGFTEAKTAQGHIGVQVWINQGLKEMKESSNGSNAKEG
ncbi:KH type-2 domain-containing protein [Planctomycetales bacterium 10988]|nr:KH type-2 domain-containing protein [Planctomycetales bacterium 10988]